MNLQHETSQWFCMIVQSVWFKKKKQVASACNFMFVYMYISECWKRDSIKCCDVVLFVHCYLLCSMTFNILLPLELNLFQHGSESPWCPILYSGKFCRVQFSCMVDLHHFTGLIFVDTCTQAHYVQYNSTYFVGLIFTVWWSSEKTVKIGPLGNFLLYGNYKVFPYKWQKSLPMNETWFAFH